MEPVFGHFYSMNWHSGTDFSLAISICKCQYVTHVFRAQFIQPLAQHKVRFWPSICLEPVDSNKAIGKDVETLALILYFGDFLSFWPILSSMFWSFLLDEDSWVYVIWPNTAFFLRSGSCCFVGCFPIVHQIRLACSFLCPQVCLQHGLGLHLLLPLGWTSFFTLLFRLHQHDIALAFFKLLGQSIICWR